ncbi:Aste57867_15378 [Aphanomyces stellatus]|uniref:peptidyl-tRNA hydrolase n=1 Tax=Aphanomyces stellatus TaxID=120398 RepID=A0A485L3Y8_9STRA|nr:hypothetical protein As57867_015322 [Aphanomyces stellatus]VFT92184.1 Aste57867_15378 [Aphanomyces stellatus]
MELWQWGGAIALGAIGHWFLTERIKTSREDHDRILRQLSRESQKEAASGDLDDEGADEVVKYEPHKMVLVVRNDLKMGKGKIAAQCGHATLGAYKRAVKRTPRAVECWETFGQAKIALKIESEDEMLALASRAKDMGIVHHVVIDAGRTQIAPNTRTVLAVGPAPNGDVDNLTGHLKLM